MSTLTTTHQPAPHSRLRELVAHHPVATFLVMVYIGNYAFFFATILLLAQTELDFLPLNLVGPGALLGHIFGVALPAFLVMAALYGRAGVRDLPQRSLRWRVGVRWHLLALFGLPVAVVGASALLGLEPLTALAARWPLLFMLVLPEFLLRIVSNLAEEIGWTGFLQARLQERHGPLKASGLVEIPFALWHLPGLIFDIGFGQLSLLIGLFGLLVIGQLGGRVIIMWLYNNTRRSVLLAGLFHAAFNTTVSPRGFAGEFIPGPVGSGLVIATGVIVAAAVLIVVFTRGRLSYQPDQVAQTTDASLTKA